MRFAYKARTRSGEIQKGTIKASTRKSALDVLEKYNLYVTSLKEEGKAGLLTRNISFGSSVKPEDLAIFTRQFAVMLKAGISPLDALRAQVAQVSGAEFREQILNIAESVEGGRSLSDAFGKYPDTFDSFYVSIIRSGEATGKVADSLEYLADHLERDYNLKQEVKGAMIYPSFVIVVFIAAFFLVMFFIVPRLTTILQNFEGDLPFSTKAIMFLSDFVRGGGWILMLLFLISLFGLPQFMKRTKGNRDFYYKYSLKVPILGNFLKKVYLTRFAENLSILMSSGLPITKSLDIVSGIIENTVYKNIISEAEEKVRRGEKISNVFNKYPEYIPPFVSQMISTGEETGKLDQTLLNVVAFYRKEVERTTSNLTDIMEPVLIAALGIGVGILAVSMFIPLFKIGLGGM